MYGFKVWELISSVPFGTDVEPCFAQGHSFL